METYKKSDFLKIGIIEEFIQDNYSLSKKGVLRGLHFQREPLAQSKLVKVINGKIFDVVVDLRKNSKYYGDHVSLTLSGNEILYIPKGFAHGFLALENDTLVMYKTTAEYSKEHESGIIWNDGTLNINWPVNEPILSKKDTQWPKFVEANK